MIEVQGEKMAARAFFMYTKLKGKAKEKLCITLNQINHKPAKITDPQKKRGNKKGLFGSRIN